MNATETAQLLAMLQEADNIDGNTFDEAAIQFDEYPIATLVELSKTADLAYEEGEPLLSDSLSDALRQFILIADPKNSYNLAVGSDVRGGKIPLPHGMGSLTQIYTDEEFRLWRQKHGLVNDAVIAILTEKLDGMSGSLHFNDQGMLRIAYSRGNGFEGADITRHVKYIKGLPKKVNPNTEVRCEIIISKANFDIVKKLVFRRDGSEYKNPRNMISGLMNSSEIPMVAYNYIDCVVYHDWNEGTVSKHNQLLAFKAQGFATPTFVTLGVDQLKESVLTTILKDFKLNSPYELDGVVIEIDDPVLRQKMNPSKATLNPEYARKYKVIDEANNAIATVHYVELRVSKRGYIIPRVHYIPFSLPGITCTHSTGYNMKFIIDNGICPGAKVHMYRGGDVVPNILRGVEKGSWTREDYEEAMSDIGEWKWTENDKGEKVHAVLTEDHASIGIKLAEAFFTAIGVEHLKLGNLKKLFDVGFDTPEYIIKATPDELAFALASVPTADKIYTSLHQALKAVTLPQFMGATGLFGRGIGKRRAQMLYDHFGKDVLNLDGVTGIREIEKVEKWDHKMASRFMNGLPAYLEFFDTVKDFVQFVEPVKVDGNLNGQVYVMTGFRNKELKSKIEAAGGEVVDSFSSKVTCVIAADPDENSGKMNKARTKGIRIIGLADVNDLFE